MTEHEQRCLDGYTDELRRSDPTLSRQLQTMRPARHLSGPRWALLYVIASVVLVTIAGFAGVAEAPLAVWLAMAGCGWLGLRICNR